MNEIITRDLDIDELIKIKMIYGIECLIYEIIKLILFIFIFYIFRTLELSIIALVAGTLLRYCSGGIHCNSFIKCLLFSSFIFTIIGIMSKYIIINNTYYLFISIVLCLIIIYKAPVSKKVMNKIIKIKKKLISLFILMILLIIPIIINNNNIKTAIILSVIIQTLSLTNMGSKFFSSWN